MHPSRLLEPFEELYGMYSMQYNYMYSKIKRVTVVRSTNAFFQSLYTPRC